MKVFVNGVEKTLADGMPLTWDGAVVLSGRYREGDNLVTYCCEGEPEQWLARGHGVVVKACTTDAALRELLPEMAHLIPKPPEKTFPVATIQANNLVAELVKAGMELKEAA